MAGMNRTEEGTREWPVLEASQDFDCDGENPMTGRACIQGHHQGYHRDEAGAEWLDDGDPAHPDWLNQ